jgi:hypothetical protein
MLDYRVTHHLSRNWTGYQAPSLVSRYPALTFLLVVDVRVSPGGAGKNLKTSSVAREDFLTLSTR